MLARRVVFRAERGRGQHGLEFHGPTESRVRREHEPVVDALDTRGERRERLWRTVGRARQPQERPANAVAISHWIELAHIAPRGGSAPGEGLAGQALDQRLGCMPVQCTGAKLLLQVKRQQRDRIGVRIPVEPPTRLSK